MAKRKLLSNDLFAALNSVGRSNNSTSSRTSAEKRDLRFTRVLGHLQDLKLGSTSVGKGPKAKRREIQSRNIGLIVNKVFSCLADGCAPEVICENAEKTLRAERFGWANPKVRALIIQGAVSANHNPAAVATVFGYKPEDAFADCMSAMIVGQDKEDENGKVVYKAADPCSVKDAVAAIEGFLMGPKAPRPIKRAAKPAKSSANASA